jgi:tetratricopeptide (TPR) repeat protein
LKKSLEIAEKHQMELEKAFILDMMGRAYEELQNFSKAKEYYRKALKLYQKKKYKEGIARQYLNLGDVYRLIGSELRAILYYKRAIKLDKKIGSISHLPSIYNSLGVLFTTLFPSVVGLSNGLLGYLIALLVRPFGFRYYKRAIKIDKILGNWEGLSFEYLNRGILYTSLSFIKKAKIQFERSIELHKRFSTTASTIHNLRDIGYSLIQMGIDPSIYLARALKLLPKLPSDKREKERNIINRLIMQARGTRGFFRNEDLPF